MEYFVLYIVKNSKPINGNQCLIYFFIQHTKYVILYNSILCINVYVIFLWVKTVLIICVLSHIATDIKKRLDAFETDTRAR